MNDLPPTPRTPRGAGVLTQTEVEAIDLGQYGGRRLHVDVEHRTFRIAWGRRQSAAFTFGRRRPVSIAVEGVGEGEPRGARYDVVIDAAPDPWPQAVRRVLAVAGACWLVTMLATRWRRDRGGNQ